MATTRSIPDKPSIGSETASTISTRGVYQTDTLRNRLSAYDVNHTVGRVGRGVVAVLCHAGVGGWRICLDGIRLSRRTHALRLALDQLPVRHRRYLRISQGQFLLLQGVVGQGAVAAPVSALELGGQGRRARFASGCTRISMKSSFSERQKSRAARRSLAVGTSSGRCAMSPVRSRRTDIRTANSC